MHLQDRNGDRTARGSAGEVFLAFLKLGLISFGGPIAHLGYFRGEFVGRRKWISDSRYADLVALCQFLPGPASSQVGFSLGVLRGNGLKGGIAAWLGFTLPSAAIMLAFGLGATALTGPAAESVLHGLKLVAAAIVAQAVWGMARTLTPDIQRAGIAFAALVFALTIGGTFGQIGPIALGALAGLWLCKGRIGTREMADFPVSRRAGLWSLALAAALFIALPIALAITNLHGIAVFEAFYRSGALVFGGGHVVLPLLQAAVVEPGWVANNAFLSGYGLAQALPGPLFTFAAYLGASMAAPFGGVATGLLALVAVFLPGLLLVYGMLPFAAALRANARADAAMQGANAAVVGILAAAFYDPVLLGSVFDLTDACLAAAGFALLVFGRMPSWLVVLVLPVAALLVPLF